MTPIKWDDLKFGDDGLIPCVVQDVDDHEILMVAWMNRQSLEMTVESGKVTFWSRSRQKLWLKGETSGNFLNLVDLRYDCDGDVLLARVRCAVAACHTGRRSCFYRDIAGNVLAEPLFDPDAVYKK